MYIINNLTNKKKLYIAVISFIIAIALISSIALIIVTQSNNSAIPKHRLQWWLEAIEWNTKRDYTGKGVKIAVLDTGIDMSHPDLQVANIVSRSMSLVSSVDDDKSHGTAIAGIIAAYPSHDKGVWGIAPSSEIISIDITDGEYIEPQSIVEGIEIAIAEQVDIISISLGLHDDNNELHQAIQKAYNLGIIIIASAGNYMDGDVLYPAKYDEVICVGSVGKDGNIISPQNIISDDVIYAPGENVVTICVGQKKYLGATGTSFSTAIITGIVSIMKEVNPHITTEEIINFFSNANVDTFVSIEKCIKYSKEIKE